LREAFRLNEEAFDGNRDFVLIARTPIVDLLESEGFKGVEAKMIEVFRKASLYDPREERRTLS
jgi:RNase P protein component